MPLTNTQYDEIMRSYQEKQLSRNRVITARREEVAARAPRMSELDAEIARLSVEEAKRRLSAGRTGADSSAETDISARAGTPADLPQALPAARNADSVWEQIDALAAEKRQLLTSLGYPEDYLEPPFECPDCRDTGYIGTERCHCFRQAAIDLVYAQEGRAQIFAEECFANFSLDYYPGDLIDRGTGISAYEAAKSAYEQCLAFVRDFDSAGGNLFLFGDTGVGKTFLCNCIAGELQSSGHSVVYLSADRLFQALADHAFGRSSAVETDYRSIFDCDLLIIDDLGTELTNSLTLSQFFVCLNERILNGKSTLISSNLGLQDISNIYSERIFSRITSHYKLLHLFGKDIRVQKQL